MLASARCRIALAALLLASGGCGLLSPRLVPPGDTSFAALNATGAPLPWPFAPSAGSTFVFTATCCDYGNFSAAAVAILSAKKKGAFILLEAAAGYAPPAPPYAAAGALTAAAACPCAKSPAGRTSTSTAAPRPLAARPPCTASATLAGSAVGAFLGAVAFELVRVYAAASVADAWQMILGGVLLLVILFAPGGLWGIIAGRLKARA
jgi:hypothetical protein